jgi:hypothetical protein
MKVYPKIMRSKFRIGNITSIKRPLSILFISICVTSCATDLPNDPESQISYACLLINNWPTDYATTWGDAVKSHNASPETVRAADYMKDYIDAASYAFEITDSEALNLVSKYKEYWEFLELDLIAGRGVLPENGLSSSKLSNLMTYCDSIGFGFKSN